MHQVTSEAARFDISVGVGRLFFLLLFLTLAGCSPVVPSLVTPESTKLEIKPGHIQQFRVAEFTSTTLKESKINNNYRTTLRNQLETTLVNFDYLQPIKSKPAYTIFADIKKFDYPVGGFEITFSTTIAYKVMDPAGKVVFDKTIDSKGKSEMSDSIVAANRGALAYARMFDNAVTSFIMELNAVSVTPIEN